MDSTKLFENTFRLYFRQLCIYALHFTDDPKAAEDIVQDAFVALWERKGEVKEFKPYLYASVRNRCLTYIKKQGISIAGSLETSLSDEELAERSETESRLWTAIDSLPERRRQVFLMSKRDGLKYEDIAYMLGISVNTVRNHIAKALEALRNLPAKIYSFFFCVG